MKRTRSNSSELDSQSNRRIRSLEQYEDTIDSPEQHPEVLAELFPSRGFRAGSNWRNEHEDIESRRPKATTTEPFHQERRQSIKDFLNPQSPGHSDGDYMTKPEDYLTSVLKKEITAQIATVSQIESDSNVSQEELKTHLQDLAELTKRLQTQHERICVSRSLDSPPSTLHRVHCPVDNSTFITVDMPTYSRDRTNLHHHLQGYLMIANLDIYLKRYNSSPFISIHNYECGKLSPGEFTDPCQISYKKKPSVAHDSLTKSCIKLLSPDLAQALNHLVRGCPHYKDRFPLFNTKIELTFPYLFYYHNEHFFKSELGAATGDLKLLLVHLQDDTKEEYNKVNMLLNKGLVTTRFIPYLFAPMSTLITSNGNTAYRQVSSLTDWAPVDESLFRSASYSTHFHNSWMVTGENFVYDGQLRKERKTFTLSYNASLGFNNQFMIIKYLNLYPVRFADEGMYEALQERGKRFQTYQESCYVTYSGSDFNGQQSYVNSRFMVDMTAYQLLHPKEGNTEIDIIKNNQLPCTISESDEDSAILLPQNVFGFHMAEKKWVNLHVNFVEPILWNKESFDSLVIDAEMKDLIEALISNKLEAEKGMDMISGKGNGLIILLHGGPGTGKTLTAESVAELAERPLYRVTCGDIGTSPTEVETYLDTVLKLGKLWNCVVLLDEADVFLEQRTLADLERNALVSVFLRVLEYYDGILILTSNRVGTFDEAFKSRIQLALHYENLTPTQRSKIWGNFISKLSLTESDSVDTADLLKHAKELATLEMNGREIRNALTTARQLAAFKKTKMNFGHLHHVIKVAGKFEKYLQVVMEGVTDDEIARDRGIR